MPFKFRKTEIEGLVIIVPHTFHDERGVYKKTRSPRVLSRKIPIAPARGQSTGALMPKKKIPQFI